MAQHIRSTGEPEGAKSDPREDLLIRFSHGHIVTEMSGNAFSVRADLYTLDNRPDGRYEGEYQLVAPPSDAFNRPPQPVPPFDQPVGPVQHVTVNAYTKGRWTFRDGSSIEAVGAANFHAVRLAKGDDEDDSEQGRVLLWLTGEQIVTGGTGRFAGAQGLKTIGGSSLVPDFPPRAGLHFPASAVDLFRVVHAEFIAGAPTG